MSDLPRMALTFGSPDGIHEVVARVGHVLNISFEPRESMYLGGDYYRSSSRSYEIIVQHNDDLGEPAEPTYPDLPTLVRIDVTVVAEPDIVAALQSLGLIMIDGTA